MVSVMINNRNNSRADWTAYLLNFNNVASVKWNHYGRHYVLDCSNWAADGITLEGYFTVVKACIGEDGRHCFFATRTSKAHQG